jgi:phenylacetate-CoA ligase
MWDKANEAMPRSELEVLQGERLAALVKKLYAKVPFYKERMDQVKVRPEDIRSLSDLCCRQA